MVDFQPILQAAEVRAGGAAALRARLPTPKSAAELGAVGDDRYLSLMSLRIFRAGLRHAMVDARWPAFETAFQGFEPRRVRMMSDEDLDALLKDRRLIRHAAKMHAVRANAAVLCDLSEDKGGFGAYLAGWPGAEAVGLWDDLAQRFSHLGGNSGPYFLRMAGKDTLPRDRRCRARPPTLGRRRQAAQGQGRPAAGPGGLQRLERGDGPPALSPEHDPGALGRLIPRSGWGRIRVEVWVFLQMFIVSIRS